MESTESAGEKLERIANTTDLQTAIERLEQRRVLQETELQNQFHSLLDDLRPKNILRNTIAEVRESTPLKNNLLKLAIGLGAGYFSRKLVVNKSAGVVKKALGAALQFGVTHFVASRPDNGDGPKKKGFFKRIFSKQ